VIANSQATLRELADYSAAADLPLPPAVVARLAPPRLPPPDVVPPLDKPYFVIVSTIEPRKNHWMLLQVWRKLVERHRRHAPSLVVIGQRGWECENVVDLLERCEAIRDFVIERSDCSDQELVTYLRHARALLFPSFAEGYGLPLVEALSVQTPVIASDLPVFREIAGAIPEYLDPLDGIGWMVMIESFALRESPLRKAQVQRLKRFRPPDWSTHFYAVEGLMDSLS
jgi:glycosyltransferase involved in cell wall biosynthesis